MWRCSLHRRATDGRAVSPPRSLRLLAVVLAMSGCGVPLEERASRVDDDRVPFELLAMPTTTSSTVPPSRAVTVCYHEGDRVVTVERQVPADPDAVLDAYRNGPTSQERERGLYSAAFDRRVLLRITRSRGIATVELAPEFAEAQVASQLDVLTELVCTLTAQPGIGQVAFNLAGDRVGVPRGDGSITSDPVTRDDYPAIA